MSKENEAAVLVAESIAMLIDALGMKSSNDERISNGLSACYPDTTFCYMANEIREKITAFKSKNG